MPVPSQHVPRRGFLGRAALALMAVPRMLSGESVPLHRETAEPDEWLRGLDAPHQLFFDPPDFAGGVPQVHVLNYLNTYKSAHGVEEKDINAVVGLWNRTTLLAVNDTMWEKYRIGEYLNLADEARQAYTRNPWRTSVYAIGSDRPAAGIESLQRRGVRYIVCSNAINLHSQQLAAARSADATSVGADLRANLLPGVLVVSAMVIAVERAQKRGFAYLRE